MIKWLWIPVFSLALLSCEESRNKQRNDIRKTFRDFSDAFFARDNTTAAKYISQRTYRYYDRILPIARTADDAGLSTLPTFDLFTCLVLRHRYEPRELEGLDSQTLILDAFSRMTFPGGAPHFLDLGDISVDGEGRTARAPVLLPPGQWQEDIKVTFLRESGTWKMDLTSVFGALGPTIEPSLVDPSSSRAEMALYHLQMHENQVISRELLTP